MTDEVPIYDGAPKRAAFDGPEVPDAADPAADRVDDATASAMPLTLPRPAHTNPPRSLSPTKRAGWGRLRQQSTLRWHWL